MSDNFKIYLRHFRAHNDCYKYLISREFWEKTYMESVNFTNDFDVIEYDDRLESEALVGWSSTCLDQTISYYVDYNYNEMNNEGPVEN